MKILFNLPEIHLYQDTFTMLNELANKVDSLEILTTPLSESGSQLINKRSLCSALQITSLPRHNYALHASQWVQYRVDTQSIDVIHDLFGHFSHFCQAYFLKPRSFILLTTQRTTNWGWFKRVKPLHYGLNIKYAGQRLLSLWRDRRILSSVDHIVVLGPGHEKDLIQAHHLPASKISYIPSETDPTLFYPPSVQDESNRDLHRLLYTGALSRNKGIDLIFDLFAHLAPKRPQLHLHLIGRFMPFEQDWFESTLNEHPYQDRITLFPAQPRELLLQHYHQANLYLFPSLFEGSPRSLREAVASGCSCIASDIAGCRGIDPQGHFLRFRAPSRLKEWIQATEEALDESFILRSQRQKQGWSRIQEAHAPHVVAHSYFDLYQKLLKSN